MKLSRQLFLKSLSLSVVVLLYLEADYRLRLVWYFQVKRQNNRFKLLPNMMNPLMLSISSSLSNKEPGLNFFGDMN
ncbi:hypothetical protein D3C76_1419170 [compost metagenome]